MTKLNLPAFDETSLLSPEQGKAIARAKYNDQILWRFWEGGENHVPHYLTKTANAVDNYTPMFTRVKAASRSKKLCYDTMLAYVLNNGLINKHLYPWHNKRLNNVTHIWGALMPIIAELHGKQILTHEEEVLGITWPWINRLESNPVAQMAIANEFDTRNRLKRDKLADIDYKAIRAFESVAKVWAGELAGQVKMLNREYNIILRHYDVMNAGGRESSIVKMMEIANPNAFETPHWAEMEMSLVEASINIEDDSCIELGPVIPSLLLAPPMTEYACEYLPYTTDYATAQLFMRDRIYVTNLYNDAATSMPPSTNPQIPVLSIILQCYVFCMNVIAYSQPVGKGSRRLSWLNSPMNYHLVNLFAANYRNIHKFIQSQIEA